MEILGLDHIQLSMPPGEEAACRSFYVGVLGLVEVPKPEVLARRGGCWFEGPGTVVHLGTEESFRPALKAHAAFRVRDLEAARNTLRLARAPVVEDDAVEGVRRFYSKDVFGNRLEFVEAGDSLLSKGDPAA